MTRVGQNRVYTPYMTVYLVVFLPKYRVYTVYIWFWPTLRMTYYTLTYSNQQGWVIRTFETSHTNLYAINTTYAYNTQK